MRIVNRKRWIVCCLLCVPFFLHAQTVRVLTNHVGYESRNAKRAVVVAEGKPGIQSFQLIDTRTGKQVYKGAAIYSGPVQKWKNWQFWTIDFSPYTTEGIYKLEVTVAGRSISSYPFAIGKNVLSKATLSDVVYYFKGQRSTGLFDKADHHLPLQASLQGPPLASLHSPASGSAAASPSAQPDTQQGSATDTLDLHGGWYDATGDYGKHLSHLTFSSYFNPQQISLTVWGLYKTNELLSARAGKDFLQINRRVLDEALYGADYLVRLRAKGGSFYRSVGAPGPGKLARDRNVQAEENSYRIKESKDQSFNSNPVIDNWRSYQVSYRSGGGMAIAALAIASTHDTSGDYSSGDYLKAAEDAFAFLEKENVRMTNDGKENVIDDYCALNAATELYKATRRVEYQAAAEKRADQLIGRLGSWGNYTNYWRADNTDRPFFHPADAGLPLVSLLYYYPYASEATRIHIKTAVRKSMEHELSITHEVNNPFGYSRQLVQDTLGKRHSSFFFPHGSEASPWWQGENARLASMATTARMAASLFKEDKHFQDTLESFALDQLNWILGLNPYDACMLQGSGHNNPSYGFFGTSEYTNATGGIVNGITSGLLDEKIGRAHV